MRKFHFVVWSLAAFSLVACESENRGNPPPNGVGPIVEENPPGSNPTDPDESPITPTPKKIPLSLITYNVWGLPWPLTVRKERFDYLSRAMIDAATSEKVAVIQFQETFAKPAREMVESLWPTPFLAWGPGSKFPKTSSGLASAFSWKVITSFAKTFSACKGTDCLSRKGAVFTRVEIPQSQPQDQHDIWFVNTHLNSAGDDSLRQKQLTQVFKWMEDASIGKDATVILTGDFNYLAESSVHSWIVKTQGFTDAWDENALRYITRGVFPPPAATFDPFNNPNAARSEKIPQRLDYVYYRSGSRVRLKMQDIRIDMTDRVLEDAQLSDHYALQADFQIEY